jgi:hypothetical protein
MDGTIAQFAPQRLHKFRASLKFVRQFSRQLVPSREFVNLKPDQLGGRRLSPDAIVENSPKRAYADPPRGLKSQDGKYVVGRKCGHRLSLSRHDFTQASPNT